MRCSWLRPIWGICLLNSTRLAYRKVEWHQTVSLSPVIRHIYFIHSTCARAVHGCFFTFSSMIFFAPDWLSLGYSPRVCYSFLRIFILDLFTLLKPYSIKCNDYCLCCVSMIGSVLVTDSAFHSSDLISIFAVHKQALTGCANRVICSRRLFGRQAIYLCWAAESRLVVLFQALVQVDKHHEAVEWESVHDNHRQTNELRTDQRRFSKGPRLWRAQLVSQICWLKVLRYACTYHIFVFDCLVRGATIHVKWSFGGLLKSKATWLELLFRMIKPFSCRRVTNVCRPSELQYWYVWDTFCTSVMQNAVAGLD